MITEIFVEGKRLDISADLSSLLTFAIDDVKDFSVRQTTFSKTVVLPGTANNNSIFGNIFETGIANSYDSMLDNIGYNFNASASARCIIFQDNIQTFKGTLRLLQINNDRESLEYEVALNGELTTLNVALSSGFLTDLDFSAYDKIWNIATITGSWDNPGGSDFYCPLIDYGTYSTNKHDWSFRTLRPALYVKEYIDKMFAKADFRYSCNLFNTPRFKKLIVPHNQKVLMSKVSNILSAALTADQTVIDSTIGSTVNLIQWDTSIAGGFSYAAGIFTYTQPTSLNTIVSWNLGGDRYSSTSGTFDINIIHNGITVATHTVATFPAHVSWSWASSVGVALATGDTIKIEIRYGGIGTAMVVTALSGNTMGITSAIPTLQPVDYGQKITLNDAIPQNIRQVDFLVSIVKLFNLYVYESQFDERLILLSPFVDYYSASSGNAVDWSYKMNRKEVRKIKPLSELNSKVYNFNYKDDNDYFNDLYKKRYNQGYGSYTFDSQFEFTSQVNKLELIFASTPLVGYIGEDKVMPTIFKRSGPDTAPVEENVDSVIRIMQTKKIIGVASWDIKNAATVLASVTNYGYAGHFDDPDVPDNDLNFGVTKELFFTLVSGDLTKTQFNLYWSSYMAEITDKDSKMLIAKFYLTPADIFSLDFSKYVYVDGALFRLNKITDYNATLPTDCEVQLLKVINTAYSFPPALPPDDFILFWSDGDALLSDDTTSLLYD